MNKQKQSSRRRRDDNLDNKTNLVYYSTSNASKDQDLDINNEIYIAITNDTLVVISTYLKPLKKQGYNIYLSIYIYSIRSIFITYYLLIDFLEDAYYRRVISSLTSLRIPKEKNNIYLKFNINSKRVGFTLYDILQILGIYINLISYSKKSYTKYSINPIVDSIEISRNSIITILVDKDILSFNIQDD